MLIPIPAASPFPIFAFPAVAADALRAFRTHENIWLHFPEKRNI
jgi:hypothetical protein